MECNTNMYENITADDLGKCLFNWQLYIIFAIQLISYTVI